MANGALFASNRDESPARAKALTPALLPGATGTLAYPTDGEAGGTWLGIHEYGHLLILLNGAYEGHQRERSYARSRGLVVKELLDSYHPLRDWLCIELDHIEPFTLVLWQQSMLYELVWDGILKHARQMDASIPHIWSSTTLYDSRARNSRRQWFHHWLLQTPNPSSAQLYSMLTQHTDRQNGFIMNRQEMVKTLSISIIDVHTDNFLLHYHDLKTNTTYPLTLNRQSKHERSCAMVADTIH